MKIYEWLDSAGKGVVTDWRRLQQEQRAKLDQKLDMLTKAEIDPGTRQANLPQNTLAGPGYDGQPWIYKLKVRGRVALRPMLCLGPASQDEWTVLVRAVERDGVLEPSDAASIAEQRRIEIVNNPLRRTLLVDDEG